MASAPCCMPRSAAPAPPAISPWLASRGWQLKPAPLCTTSRCGPARPSWRRSRSEHDPSILADSLAEIEAVAGAARAELRVTLADLCRIPDGRGLDLALVSEGRTFTA